MDDPAAYAQLRLAARAPLIHEYTLRLLARALTRFALNQSLDF
jgi:hypothetical protein